MSPRNCKHPLDGMSVDEISEALSTGLRRRILAYLSKTDVTAGGIAQRFAYIMSQPAISKHCPYWRVPA